MWAVSSLLLNSRGVYFVQCGLLRNKALMSSGFLIDSPGVPVTVLEVPRRQGIDSIDVFYQVEVVRLDVLFWGHLNGRNWSI